MEKKLVSEQKIAGLLDFIRQVAPGTPERALPVLKSYSGERQRETLANLLALALEPLPNILILDEPMSGVDVTGHHELMDMMDEIRKTYDLSILMTTHDFDTLHKSADQVVLIDGTVIKQGDPATVLESPEFSRVFHSKGGMQ